MSKLTELYKTKSTKSTSVSSTSVKTQVAPPSQPLVIHSNSRTSSVPNVDEPSSCIPYVPFSGWNSFHSFEDIYHHLITNDEQRVLNLFVHLSTSNILQYCLQREPTVKDERIFAYSFGDQQQIQFWIASNITPSVKQQLIRMIQEKRLHMEKQPERHEQVQHFISHAKSTSNTDVQKMITYFHHVSNHFQPNPILNISSRSTLESTPLTPSVEPAFLTTSSLVESSLVEPLTQPSSTTIKPTNKRKSTKTKLITTTASDNSLTSTHVAPSTEQVEPEPKVKKPRKKTKEETPSVSTQFVNTQSSTQFSTQDTNMNEVTVPSTTVKKPRKKVANTTNTDETLLQEDVKVKKPRKKPAENTSA